MPAVSLPTATAGAQPTGDEATVTRLAGPDFMIEIEAVAVVNS